MFLDLAPAVRRARRGSGRLTAQPPAGLEAGPPGPAATPRPGRGRLILFNLALLASSLVLGLGAAEVAVRIAAPQQLIEFRPDIWRPADTVGYLRNGNVRARINTGERTVSVFTDAEGFRVGTAGRREAPLTVLLLGDSFMEALQVDYEQSLAGLLEAQLPAHVGTDVVVRQAGIAGWDPNHYLLRARQLLPREPFALVVVALYVGNDLIRERVERFPAREAAERHTFGLPSSLRWSAVVESVLYPLNNALETRSHLFVLLKKRLRAVRMRMGLSPAYVPPGVRRADASGPLWDVTADACRDLAALAASRGVPAAFVLIPAPQLVDAAVLGEYVRAFRLDSLDLDFEQPHRLLPAALRARGLTVVDALPALRRAAAAGTRLYGSVDDHLTPEGHAALAAAALDTLVAAVAATARRATGRPR